MPGGGLGGGVNGDIEDREYAAVARCTLAERGVNMDQDNRRGDCR